MSEFKFFCPQCGQRLSAEDSWAGNQIQCPNCQNNITIPAPLGAVASAGLKVASAAPPPIASPTPVPAPTPASAPRPSGPPVSGMAIASLICLIAVPFLNLIGMMFRFPLGFAGLLPSIWCGHQALGEIYAGRRSGKILARITLTISYILLVLHVLVTAAYIYKKYINPPKQSAISQPAPRTPRATPKSIPSREQSTTAPVKPARPADPRVTTDPMSVTIPDAPVSGTVWGKDFKVDAATIGPAGFELRQGKGFFADLSIRVVLFNRPGELLDGRKFAVSSQARPGAGMTVWISRKQNNTPETQAIMSNLALRLEFGERKGNKLPGKIYLELPKSYETKLMGIFEADVK
jgi:hypothetical protein